ncbi:MAG: AbrB/MazE/SpoVT family DNA-binding domain-containing protein [Nanoarchaeota archaeon]|nr:AbrB/MazE/SpoVT family DNA-binding domain-containing protein [Nanoarchaeota archaeon]
MPMLEERRVTLSGSSLIMTLPKEWIEENGIKAGDTILIKVNGHIEIRAKNNENLDIMNKEILQIRNQLSHSVQSVANGSRNAAAGSG